jgi:hypothetical protein
MLVAAVAVQTVLLRLDLAAAHQRRQIKVVVVTVGAQDWPQPLELQTRAAVAVVRGMLEETEKLVVQVL